MAMTNEQEFLENNNEDDDAVIEEIKNGGPSPDLEDSCVVAKICSGPSADFVYDCGKEAFITGATCGLVGSGASTLASNLTKVIGREAGRRIAVGRATTTTRLLINTGQAISVGQKVVAPTTKAALDVWNSERAAVD
ncbi:hypothetical protein BGZ54_003464 [Gamsiella multidivaricata]|nr:hypothetical protein BGZ54_003464 [Gamsiella multidivaricata]